MEHGSAISRGRAQGSLLELPVMDKEEWLSCGRGSVEAFASRIRFSRQGRSKALVYIQEENSQH